MVVLMEYAPGAGMTMKRTGEEEPGLFTSPDDSDGHGVPLYCRATKTRRLESAGIGDDVPAAASVATEGDVMMAEEPPAPSLGAAEGEKMAVVVYGDQAVDAARAGGPLGLLGQWRLRPWAPLSAGAEWIRDMLREADGRTVREVLSSAKEEGGADLALVPWAAAHVPAETNQASTDAETMDEEEDAEGTAVMEVEVEAGHHQTQTVGAGCGEGYLCRWPQHCLPPPPLPAIRQASPAVSVWSW